MNKRKKNNRCRSIWEAYTIWYNCVYMNNTADAACNDLLEDICKQSGKSYYNIEEDPIYYTIFNLTNSQRRRFIKGCEKIINS